MLPPPMDLPISFVLLVCVWQVSEFCWCVCVWHVSEPDAPGREMTWEFKEFKEFKEA